MRVHDPALNSLHVYYLFFRPFFTPIYENLQQRLKFHYRVVLKKKCNDKIHDDERATSVAHLLDSFRNVKSSYQFSVLFYLSILFEYSAFRVAIVCI